MSDTLQYTGQLPPLIEGESFSYSFLVPGWYLVLGILLLALLFTGALRYRKFLKNAYRREALKKVDTILGGQPEAWCFEIGILLKALAVEKFGRERVAALQGTEWYRFLQATSEPDETYTAADIERFVNYNYNGQVPERDLGNKLGDFARHWIRTHHAG